MKNSCSVEISYVELTELISFHRGIHNHFMLLSDKKLDKLNKGGSSIREMAQEHNKRMLELEAILNTNWPK